MELKLMCGLCRTYFACTPNRQGQGRICVKRPLDKKGGVDFIQMGSLACEDFDQAQGLYCPHLNYYMSFGSCLKTCREYRQCPQCKMGMSATILFRRRIRND